MSNAVWSYRQMLRGTPASFFVMAAGVPLGVLLAWAELRLPALVVSEVTGGQTFLHAALAVGALLALTFLAVGLRDFCKTILEALNTDLVCDAINTAMRQLFEQIVYGRSQSAFSEGGLSVGASLEDLGKGLRSQVGTMFATKVKGPRYLEMAEGYVTRLALNKDDEIVGYEFISLGKMMDFIKKGDDAAAALEKAKGHYGQFDNAAKYIDPRQE